MPTRHVASARGQATTETLFLTILLVALFASAYQVFLANRAVFRTMAAVHHEVFQQAFTIYNCSEGRAECEYDGGDAHINVAWTDSRFASVRVPVIGFFRPGLADLQIRRPDGDPKRTRMAAGTYKSTVGTLWWALRSLANPRFWGSFLDGEAVVDALMGFL